MPAPKKAALYLRVSTATQTLSNQRSDVEQLARARGFETVEYLEIASAEAKRRPVLDQMLRDARDGRVNAVVVWSLDRLYRKMHKMVSTVIELDRLGVGVISVNDGWLDTAGPARTLLVGVLGWVAEYERNHLIARTNAGLARARAEGKRLGRPPASPVLVGAAIDQVAAGTPIKAAARRLGIPEATIRRAIRSRNAERASTHAETLPRV